MKSTVGSYEQGDLAHLWTIHNSIRKLFVDRIGNATLCPSTPLHHLPIWPSLRRNDDIRHVSQLLMILSVRTSFPTVASSRCIVAHFEWAGRERAAAAQDSTVEIDRPLGSTLNAPCKRALPPAMAAFAELPPRQSKPEPAPEPGPRSRAERRPAKDFPVQAARARHYVFSNSELERIFSNF